ncbi:MinD/ParA family ATP-binding protein [Microbacterium rhizophilus]|uniref:MinD/ParA family ATP-binding protein n=1 Tax=Microbacterium rhizophilus TaxID=3138934 RepID=UPI0031EA0702
MTDREEIPDRPRISVVTNDDGTGTVTVDGATRAVKARDAAGARKAVLALVVEVAQEYARPVRVAASGSDGVRMLVVAPDGSVEEGVGSPAEAPAPVAVPEAPGAPTILPDIVTSVPKSAPGADPEPAAPAQAAAPLPAPAAAAPAPRAEAEPSLTRRGARLLTARDFAESAKPVLPVTATEGFRGGMNRLGFRMKPGKAEQAKRDRRETVQRAFSGRKTIAVIGEKGGVGKTTTTYLLGATLGRVRGGSVLAWDNNEFKGTLGIRSLPSPDHDHTAIDLLGHVQSVGTGELSSADLIDFVRAQGENKFDVLASQSLDGDSDVIDEEAFGLLHETLSRSYRVIIVDTGNNSKAGTWQSAVAEADVLVLTTIVKEDSARTLASMADTLVAHGHEAKLRNAVTVMSHPSPTSYPDLERRLTTHMGQLTRQVVSVPFDPALDRGDVIDYDALSDESREAWLEVTAAVAAGLR